jgi:acyl carrier protein
VDAHDAEDVLRQALAAIAPDARLDDAGPDDDIAYRLDLDSMDVLDLVTYVFEHTGIDIPERDYPAIRTRRGFADYLVAATSDGPTGAPVG